MAQKTLADFNYDYQAYADYLESPQAANDSYDIYVDVTNGDIYRPTDGDWSKGHGHENVKTGYDRKPDNDKSKGRGWKNRWDKLVETLQLNPEEAQLLASLYINQKTADNNVVLTEEPTKKTR